MTGRSIDLRRFAPWCVPLLGGLLVVQLASLGPVDGGEFAPVASAWGDAATSVAGPLGVSGGLVAGALAGAFAAVLWQMSFRQSGHGWLFSIAATLLLVANPAWLALHQLGPSAVLCALGTWIACAGLAEMRAYPGAPPAMTIGLGLVIAAFSHPMGVIFAATAGPLFVLASPAAMLKRSPLGVALGLLFPVVFAFAGLCFIRWILFGNTLPPMPRVEQLHWGAALHSSLAALALLFPMMVLLVRASNRPPLLIPATVAVLAAVVSATVAGLVGVGPTLVTVAPAIALAPLAAAFQPRSPRRALWSAAVVAAALGLGAAFTMGVI